MTPPPPPTPNTGSTEETTRRPREPLCFQQDVGKSFIYSSVLASAYYLPKGGLQAVYTKVPPISCKVAVTIGTYKAIKYAMVSAHRKEEPVLNSAVAMGGAMGITNMPRGVRAAAFNALFGGALAGALTAGMNMLEEHLRRKLEQSDDPKHQLLAQRMSTSRGHRLL